MTHRILFPLVTLLFFAHGVLSQGKVFLVLGSDTAIWEGMDVTRYHCTYALSLYTDPFGNAARVMEPAFRSILVDSYGTPVKFTWWMMAGNIFRHATNSDVPDPNTMTLYLMKKYQGAALKAWGDELSMHYHTFVWTDYDGDGTSYWNQAKAFSESADDFDVTLAAQLLEEGIFPVSFRSGWHAMDNPWQQRLDEILPFSMHNDWPAKRSDPTEPIDNVFDWSRSPNVFVPFHPSPGDYQIPGNGRGWNVRSRYMSAADSVFMANIFAAAAAGTDQVVCLWAHLPETDFLDNVRKVNSSAHKAASRYPAVQFRYCTAVEAMQRWLQTADTTRPALSVREIPGSSPLRWRIESSEPAFQPVPFVAAKTRYGEHIALHVRLVAVNTWETTDGVQAEDVAKVAAAVTDTAGNLGTALLRYLPEDVYVDDEDPGFSEVSGLWTHSTTAAWGRTSRLTGAGSPDPVEVRWTPVIQVEGLYTISVRVPRLSLPAQKTLFRFLDNGIPVDTITFDRTLPPDSWIYLATRHLRAGSSLSLSLCSPGPLAAGTQMGVDVAKFSALVKDRWIVAPEKLDAGDLIEDEPAAYTMVMSNEGVQPVSLLSFAALGNSTMLKDPLPVVVPPMGIISMRLQIDAGPPGRMVDTLVVGTDDPRHPLLRIPLSASIHPYFRIIDDLDSAGYLETGTWSTSVAQAYGLRSRYAYPAAGVSAEFKARLRKGGEYEIREMIPKTVNASPRARYILRMDGVSLDTLFADQNMGSGAWKSLMKHACPAGAVIALNIADDAVPPASGYVLRADAMRFQWIGDGTTSTEGGGNQLPAQFLLEQNYPNPFNPTTTVAFALPAAAQTRIDIFDILGRTVATPVRDVRSAGLHTVQFDASQYPSGVYFIRMQSAGFVAVRRMMLVR
jgi:hypothetical protein